VSWVLSSCRGRRRRRRGPEGVLRRVGLAVVVSLLVAGALTESHAVTGRLSLQLVNLGGGSGGLSGDAVWAKTWWNGSPQGPGPYEGPTSGGAAICIWHDFGPGLANLNNGLSEASLPLSFWQAPDGGGHPGIWGVDEWAESRLRSGAATDHFDLVACPDAGQVPASGGVVEANLPRAFPPNSSPLYVWLFWDTVRDPPAGGLPGVIGEAFDKTDLPSPAIGTSPIEVGGVEDATVVNLATWLWVDPGQWHTYSATASGGGYVATVWAVPVSVTWTATWNFPSTGDDPEGGTTFGPEVLDQVCNGPGAVYDPAAGTDQTTDCSFEFSQSSFGTDQPLRASVTWDVSWALSNDAGVVGGEGSFGTTVTTSSRPLRVMQVESVISSG
jgi:hypothetical protein